MPERIPTPPPPVDRSKYLVVMHPFPLNANLDLDTDQCTLALWLGCCAGKGVLQAVFYKPSSPEMVVIQVDPEFDRFHGLLGLHVWSEFLVNPTKEQMDKSSTVLFSTYNTDRLAKGGWKRVDIEEHWFHGWSPKDSIIRYPYPKTSQCNAPSSPEANSGAPVCPLIPQGSFTMPSPPPAPLVGSAEWLGARNSNEGPRPASMRKGKTAAPGNTASVTRAGSKITKPLSPPPAQSPSSGTRPRGPDDPDYDPWNPPVDAAVPAGSQSGPAGAVNPWEGYDVPRLEPLTKLKEADVVGESKDGWRERLWQVFGNASSNSSSSSESDSETLANQAGPSAPPRPDQEEWSAPWGTGGTETRSTVGSAPLTLDSVVGLYDPDDDDESEGASVARSHTTNMSSIASRSSRTSPPASVSPNSPLTYTQWGGPIAIAREDGRKKGEKGANAEGGQKMSKSARKRRNKGRNALAQAQAEAQAAQASLLEATFDVELPTGGTSNSWGDPDEAW